MKSDDHDVHRAYLALLLAVLDDECDRFAVLLHHPGDEHFACHVAHYLAHKGVSAILWVMM